jgi:hypothetical protein
MKQFPPLMLTYLPISRISAEVERTKTLTVIAD